MSALRLNTAALSLLCLLLAPLFVSCDLLGAILLSRHGTRAPNAVTASLCPADSANFHRYASLDISLEGVTGRGMLQLYQLGEYTKQRYVDSGFLLPFYSNEQVYIRAVGEDRTLQSAVAWGQALYPAGHAPMGYKADVPSPLPVYTLPDELDTLLENRKAGCHGRLKDDVAAWDASEGAAQRDSHSALLHQLEQLCGVNLTAAVQGSGDNYGDAIKDITDLWTFDFIEHFPALPGLSVEQLLQFRSYAVTQLIGRILGTDEQVTYMNGDLPVSMLRSFQALIDQRENATDGGQARRADIDRAVKPLRFIAYHGHREMMYALAAFFDLQFNISYPALPLGAIPPATSIFLELHSGGKDGDSEDEYVVKAVLWTPCDDEQHREAEAPLVTVERTNLTDAALNATTQHNHTSHHNATATRNGTHNAHHNHTHPAPFRVDQPLPAASAASQCGGRSLAIGKCAGGVCSFDEFHAVIRAQLNRTGSWHTLCHARQHSERYSHNRTLGGAGGDADDVDHKVGGAGRTADHSPGYGATEGSEEEAKGSSRASSHAHSSHNATSHHQATNSTAADSGAHGHHKSGGHSGWSVLFWALVLSAVIGGAAYYYFVMRRSGRRNEYQAVPGRP